MKSLNQLINEELIMELSSDLLSRAAKKAKEKGKNAQANRFAVAAGKALARELKDWKPGPDAKNCGQVVATVKDMVDNNADMKKLAASDPASETTVVKFPVIKELNDNSEYDYEFLKYKDVKVPKAKFYIFKDEYHNCLHIGTLSDLLVQVAAAYFDFEDFDASYIVKTFDNIKDAVKYAIENNPKKYYDSRDFMDSVLEDDITDDDCYWDGPGNVIIDMMLNYANIKNLPSDWDK